MSLLDGPIRAAGVGVELLAEELKRQGVEVDSLDWTPAADGADVLRRLAPAAARIGSANDEGIRRLRASRPLLVGVAPAAEVIPDMDQDVPARRAADVVARDDGSDAGRCGRRGSLRRYRRHA